VQVIRTADGQTASNSSAAQIGSPSPSFAFTGGLASVPGNGSFTSSGYAATNRPTFDGSAAAFAIVKLFARPANADTELPPGETVADSGGHWSLTTGPIATGTYLITAVITPPAGYPSEMMALTANNGTFHIDLAPGSSSAKARPGADAARHAGRSSARHLAEHRTAAHRARVARATPTEGPIRPARGS
jgi:hypothetical protein